VYHTEKTNEARKIPRTVNPTIQFGSTELRSDEEGQPDDHRPDEVELFFD
jgi:hypothetical protein